MAVDMIKKGKYYICVGEFLKKDPYEVEPLGQTTDNSFIQFFYNGNRYMTTSASLTWSSVDGTARRYSFEPDPSFIIGNMYRCINNDNELLDTNGQYIKIMPYNYANFIEFDFNIDDEAQSRIDTFASRGCKVEIWPDSKLVPGDTYIHGEPVSIDNVDISYIVSMGYRFRCGCGRGHTQLESIANAWKSLRVKSPLVETLCMCLSGRYSLWCQFNKAR